MICLFIVVTSVKANPISVNKLQNPFGYYSNSTSLVKDDFVNLKVENSGDFSVMTRFSVYLDENTELSSYHADRTAVSSNKVKEHLLEPTAFTDDLYNEDNEAAWTKMMISKDEEVNFEFSYSAVGGNSEKKKINKFLSELVLDTEDPQQVNVVITSSNFNATSYPSNSKHLWVVRCHHDFIFNLRILNFEVENEFDGLNFYDLSEGSRRLISEASGLGTTETNTNNLLMVFKSDCDSNFSGFRAVLTAVEKNIAQETTSSVSDLPKTTQSILETSTYSPEKTTKFYGTTEINTTTSQEPTQMDTTTSQEPTQMDTTTSQEATEMSTTTSQKTTQMGTTTSQETTQMDTTTSQEATEMSTTTSQKTTQMGTTTSQETTQMDTTTSQEATEMSTTTSQEPTQMDTTTYQEGTQMDTTTSQEATGMDTTTSQEATGMDTTTYQEGTSVKMTTPSNLQTTTSALGKLEVVEQDMFWAEARQFCISKHGDLIQKDPRILTKEGRNKLSEELGMQYHNYHMGIRRDQNNTNIWRRSSDGVEVSLEGWYPGYPRSDDGFDFLYWYFFDNSNKNTVYDFPDYQCYFICEY